jgi:HEAT repeat protein
MIALTAIVQHQEGSLPDRRVELYDKALRMLVETWNKRRSLSAVQLAIPEGARLDYYDFCEVWAPIAFWMHETQPTAGVHTVDLRNRLVEQLGDRVPDGKTAEATADSYIDAASRHTGLLRERGADRWSFFHQTFQEYLAAQQFVALMAATPEVLNRATDPRWREVTRLAVGYVGVIQRNSRGAEGILNKLLETGDVLHGDVESLERHTYRHVLLVAGCIADQPRVSSRLENQVVERLLDACEGAKHEIAQGAFCDALEAMDDVRLQAEASERCREAVTESGSWRVREGAARLLGRSPADEDTRTVLLSAVRGPNPDVHSVAAEALGRHDRDLLVTLARDKELGVRSAAAGALARIGTRDDLTLLLTLAQDEDSAVGYAAAQALGRILTRDDLTLLLTPAQDEDGNVRYAAAHALARIGTRDGLPLLQTVAKDQHWSLRYAAAQALARIGTRDDLPLLQTLAQDEDGNVRDAAARALARILTRDDLALLQTLAKDQHWSLRYAAALALARIGTRDDLPWLGTLAKDEDPGVRSAAAKGLAKVMSGEELRGMYEGETEEEPKETCFTAMWYAVHGEG